MGRTSSLGSVVMIVNDFTRFPSGFHPTPHNPARPKGSLVLRCTHIGTLRLPSMRHSYNPSAGIMHRRRSTRGLKEGNFVSVSARALIIRLPMEGSAAHAESIPSAGVCTHFGPWDGKPGGGG